MTPSPIIPEFSRVVPLSEIGAMVVAHSLKADAEQRAALAKRFDLLTLDVLSAEVTLCKDDVGIIAAGHLTAELTQRCVVSEQSVPAMISEKFSIRFVPESDAETDTEIELGLEDCDTVFHDGRIIDLGEAVAQTLALSIDPFPRSPNADDMLKKAGVKGEHEAGPFAALAALRKGGD